MSTDATTAAGGRRPPPPSEPSNHLHNFPIGPGPSETPLHTTDYVDSDDEELFNSILDRIADRNQEQQQRSSTRSSLTSKSFINSLPIIKTTSSSLKSCSICKDDFAVSERLNQLPCKHVFHHDCIVPWLNRSNSCPLCRHKLPVEQRPMARRFIRLRDTLMQSEDIVSRLLVDREIHSGLGNEGVDVMLDEDGDTLMHDAYED